MNHLYRDLAPLSDQAWEAIDDEARRSVRHFLAGRHLFPLEGPHGYDIEAVTTGRIDPQPSIEEAEVAIRRPQPYVELRAPFVIPRRAVDVLDRGGDIDLECVVDASRRIAGAEDRIVFDGLEAAGIEGVAAASPYEPVQLGEDFTGFASAAAKAVAELRSAGVDGPFGIALGPREHRAVIESTEHGGYPVLNHVRLILDGPAVWAPTIDGAVVVSMRGGDFEIHSGLDFSIRYVGHDRDEVHLELIETVSFRNLSPEAAIRISR